MSNISLLLNISRIANRCIQLGLIGHFISSFINEPHRKRDGSRCRQDERVYITVNIDQPTGKGAWVAWVYHTGYKVLLYLCQALSC